METEMVTSNAQAYGFYSAQADASIGHAIWLNENGQEVKVTLVSRTVRYVYQIRGRRYDKNLDCQWDDTIAVGLLTEFVRSEWLWEQYPDHYFFIRTPKVPHIDRYDKLLIDDRHIDIRNIVLNDYLKYI